jgi:hypothetical protein
MADITWSQARLTCPALARRQAVQDTADPDATTNYRRRAVAAAAV